MINISVLEIQYHFDVLYRVAYLAKHCGASVTIFTTKDIHEKTKPFFADNGAGCSWVLKGESESSWCFLKRIAKFSENNIDLLFINTWDDMPHRQFMYYFFNPKCKTVLTIVRVESWFGDWEAISFLSLKKFILSLLRNVGQLIRKKTLQRFDGIIVENRMSKNYAVSFGYKKHIHCMPGLGFFYEGTGKHRENAGILKFVVLGSLVDYRRDYDGLLDAFEKLFNSGRKDIMLSLVGAPKPHDQRKKGMKIIERCRALKSIGYNINYYTEFVPENILFEEILSANVIINPIKIDNYKMTTTGAVIRAVQFAKPGIYPVNGLLYEELMSSSLFYNKIEELPGMIEHLLNNREILKKLSKNAIANSEKFSLEKVAKDFQESVIKSHLPDLSKD